MVKSWAMHHSFFKTLLTLLLTITLAACGGQPSASDTLSSDANSASALQANREGANNKVVICHIPPGNAEAAHTIEVAPSAVSAHLDHGDSMGNCSPTSETEPSPEPIAEPVETPAPSVEPDPTFEQSPDPIPEAEVEPSEPPANEPTPSPAPEEPTPTPEPAPSTPAPEPAAEVVPEPEVSPAPEVEPEPELIPAPTPEPETEIPPILEPTHEWYQQAYIKPSNPQASGGFAGPQGNNNVAIDGDTMVVGSATADVDGIESAGLVYVFTRGNNQWSQQTILQAPTPTENSFFGYSVSISNNTLVVGASYEDSAGINSGAAYVFVRDADTWNLQARLEASNAGAFHYFGGSVSISQNTIVVGAYGESSVASNSGAAYVFERTGSSWVQQSIIRAVNASRNAMFATSVAISNDTIVVGAFGESSGQKGITNSDSAPTDESAPYSGAAYVYVREEEGNWIQQAYLKSQASSEGDIFGLSVAIDSDSIVVGAFGESSLTSNSGAAFVFIRNGDSWSEHYKLKAANPGSGDQYGWMVAISGDRILVSAPYEDGAGTSVLNGSQVEDNNGTSNAGAVYLYSRSGASWEQEAYVKASRSQAGLAIGDNLAISGTSIVVSSGGDMSSQNFITNGETSPNDYGLADSGAAYVFDWR